MAYDCRPGANRARPRERKINMRRAHRHLVLALLAPFAACGGNASHGGSQPDLSYVFIDNTPDGGGGLNVCGDTDPTCQDVSKGPANGAPFPLHSDPNQDPNETDQGVGRDPNGYLGLDSSHASFDYLWIANTGDWGRGSLSKIDSKTVREVARYWSITCYSYPNVGSTQTCDGTKGCCAFDDFPRFQARQQHMQQPGHQQILIMNNSPSRTAVDWNGDMFVANRAFGGQSSVTKIANDPSECVDRNHNGRIDTSTDANGDGLIQTDCNQDGMPDNMDQVKQNPCKNNAKQEFFGDDDECVLWTTNTNIPDQWGRPLGLAAGATDFGPSDAWAGTYQDGKFFHLDGTTGMTKEMVQLPQGCQPYGLAVDSSGYGWSPNLSSGPLCFFDTKHITNTNKARDPTWGQMVGYGVGLDRDQNIWVGGYGTPDAYRYTPKRTNNGFADLDKGWWVHITNAGTQNGANSIGRGIAADSRTLNQYWVWLASNDGHVVRLPGSDLNKTMGVTVGTDSQIDGRTFPAAQVDGQSTSGVGVDRDQNVWGISGSPAVATRVLVDKMGNLTPPMINTPPMGANKCPAGDKCDLDDNPNSQPSPYTYSDFTGFGLRNFTSPMGSYSYVLKGCVDGSNNPLDTHWVSIVWDADVPPNTQLTVHARSGNTPKPDQTWGKWTTDFTMSPADLITNMALDPNNTNDGFLEVEFIFATKDKNATPKLKSFDIGFKCGWIP
jgi:hypothetical protein